MRSCTSVCVCVCVPVCVCVCVCVRACSPFVALLLTHRPSIPISLSFRHMLLFYVHDDLSFVLQKHSFYSGYSRELNKTLALLAEKCKADKQGRDEAQVESFKLIALVNFTAKQ